MDHRESTTASNLADWHLFANQGPGREAKMSNKICAFRPISSTAILETAGWFARPCSRCLSRARLLAAGLRAVDVLQRSLFGERLGIVVALNQRAAERSQRVGLGFGFDAFDDAAEAHIAAQGQQGFDDLVAGWPLMQIGDEAAVDLDLGQRQRMELAQAREASYEIIQGYHEH